MCQRRPRSRVNLFQPSDSAIHQRSLGPGAGGAPWHGCSHFSRRRAGGGRDVRVLVRAGVGDTRQAPSQRAFLVWRDRPPLAPRAPVLHVSLTGSGSPRCGFPLSPSCSSASASSPPPWRLPSRPLPCTRCAEGCTRQPTTWRTRACRSPPALRKIRKHHTHHHTLSDQYWLAFTVPAIDTLFGTNPPTRTSAAPPPSEASCCGRRRRRLPPVQLVQPPSATSTTSTHRVRRSSRAAAARSLTVWDRYPDVRSHCGKR